MKEIDIDENTLAISIKNEEIKNQNENIPEKVQK